MKKHPALLLFAATATVALSQTPTATLHVGDPAPPLVIAKWAKGQPVAKLGNGNVDIVEFWATWCGPCRQSIPHLTELAKKYQGKATFIGVDSFEHDPNAATCYPKVEKFVADFGEKMNYNVAIDGVDGVMGKTWMDAAAQPGIPTAFVVDRSGRIAWIGHPMMGLDEVVGKVIDGTFDLKAEAARQAKEKQDEQAAQAKQMKLVTPIIDARKAGNFRQEVVAIDKAIEASPQMKPVLAPEKFSAMSQYDEPAAMKYADELADTTFRNNPSGLNGLAWTLVEDNSPIKHPNAALAIRLAQRALKLSNDDPMIGDTLALAYFRAHRLGDALDTQRKAVAKAAADKSFDAATLTEMKGRLTMYENSAK